ncbi:MAG: LysM peptidoglycan-binding domain-containing protein [Alphaproteobacteria bacterium]|nr:LysM peptidoglycan-binding domain-containing protein [Alphaproteobacteria bacterium]
MAKKNQSNMGKTKRSTDDMIDSAIAKQNDWLENRREYTRGFLKSLNLFARKKTDENIVEIKSEQKKNSKKSLLRAYWFPVACVVFVLCVAVWGLFIRDTKTARVIVVPSVPQAIVQPVEKEIDSLEIKEDVFPEFDIVRIEQSGSIVVAGRWLPNQNVSVVVNGDIVATERTNYTGEFVYAPTNVWKAGNYTISLMGINPDRKSKDNVFVYISEQGARNSVSLLMTSDGSTLLQAPKMLRDGDLSISKIDYLSTGRIVITGDGMPRLRVSLSLNGKYLGFARVSDHRHFGLGADVGDLKSGEEYTLTVRMHDGDGRTVANVSHQFVMPEMTGDDDTFYTVRRGDCLWIIARNFLRRGILFSIIAEKNNIKNPDLIFPKQNLQIPVEATKND